MEHRPQEKRPGICIANNSKEKGNNPTSDEYLFTLIYESLQDNLNDYPQIKKRMKELPQLIQKNHPFKGLNGLTTRLGNPDQKRDCILVEVNQHLYLDYQKVKQDPLGGKNEQLVQILNQYIETSLHEAIGVILSKYTS